ncbi:MAG: hypothetical protein Q8882_06080 [Bacillota bacterium]|nr:hypothetical protein [Bacillota bacterium]
MNYINVNLREKTGKIKALNGVNCAPYDLTRGSNQTYIDKYFREGNIPYSRLHDCCGVYGGHNFVDIPNVFRNFDADENDPKNYDFHYTDEYIKSIVDAGTDIVYRLGITIEWGSKNYTAVPPKDFKKWARICEHIIMHYNKGWADGFNFNITYWEIWNEPENPPMWTGTKEEFFELYKITSIYLKEKFPDLKIGGYGSCGFYTNTRKNPSPLLQTFIPYFEDFLKMCKEEKAPLDFFSWHIYSADEKEVLSHAEFARKTLDKYGFQETEAHLNEWNIHMEGRGFLSKHTMEGASFNGAVMCILQQTDYVDKAMYYCFSLHSSYTGLLNQNDTSVVDPSWYPFVAFGYLAKLGTAVKTDCDGDRIYAASATDNQESGVLITNYRCEDNNVCLHVEGGKSKNKVSLLILNNEKRLEEEFTLSFDSASFDLQFKLPKENLAYIRIK